MTVKDGGREEDIDIVGDEKKGMEMEERRVVETSLYGPAQFTEVDVLQANTKKDEEEDMEQANGDAATVEEGDGQRRWCSNCQVRNNTCSFNKENNVFKDGI